MAIINCPECNKELSDKAVTCPNCGFPLTTNQSGELEKAVGNSLSGGELSGSIDFMPSATAETAVPAISPEESMRQKKRNMIIILTAAIVFILIAVGVYVNSSKAKITQETLDFINDNLFMITYDEVSNIVGSPGELIHEDGEYIFYFYELAGRKNALMIFSANDYYGGDMVCIGALWTGPHRETLKTFD